MTNADRIKRLKITLICFICLIVLSVFGKFGIYDRFQALAAAGEKYQQQHDQLLLLEERLKDYDDIQEEYRSYSRKWMNSNENKLFSSVERNQILDLIERKILSCGTIRRIDINGDMLVVAMSDMSLEQVSEMMEALRTESIVDCMELSTAATQRNAGNMKLVDFNLTIELKPSETEAKNE